MKPALNDIRTSRPADAQASPGNHVDDGGALGPSSGDGRVTSATSIGMAVAAAAAVVGVVLRWWPRSVLWLDEAQSVAFASLPLDEIPHALREDGAPPAYYVLLHVWMRLFGSGDVAVRALTALLSTVTLVVAVVVVRRRWGNQAAFAAFVVLATSPFAIRYATHARMYSLVMLEVVLGLVLVDRALQRDRWPRLAAVTLVAAALLYTHYWGLYLVATTAVVLWIVGLAARPGSETRRARRRTSAAVLAGFVLWAPWFPTFLFQSRHTATPWAAPAHVATALQTFASTAAGPSIIVTVLGVVVATCFALGVRSQTTGPVSGRAIGIVGLATALAAISGAIISASAASSRYLAVAVPLVLVTAAVGAARLRPTLRAGTLVIVGLLGVWLAREETVLPRTTAAGLAPIVTQEAQPGDRVVYCPDQLAPAMHRLLARSDVEVDEAVFPIGSSPSRVDWIDYTSRARAAEPNAFTDQLIDGDSTIWLVVSMTYPPTQRACAGLLRALLASPFAASMLTPDRPGLVEHGALWRFEPPI